MVRPQSTPHAMQQTSMYDDGSFASSQYGMSAGGLSTDGHGVYEESSQLSRPSISGDNLYAMQKANINREKNVRSAPASMPGSITTGSSTVQFKLADTSQLGESVTVAETDELDWLLHVIVEHPPPQPVAPPRKPSAARSRPNSSAAKPKAAPALHFDSFLLHLVDKDLQHGNDIGFPEVENEPWAPPGPTFHEEDEYENEDYSQDGFENAAEGDMWSKSFKGASSKSYLAKGSVLALIDDHKHDTSQKHSRAAGEDFFEDVARKAAAVGLDEIADKIAPSRSRKSQFQEFPGGSEVLTFSDDSRPVSPDGRMHSRGTSGGNEGVEYLTAGGNEVSWDDAFESDFEPVSFDPEKVRKSKSMEPTRSALAGGSIKVQGKSKSRPSTADSATIEEIMKGIVDVEEDDGSPFKSLKTGRRRSFNDIAVVVEDATSPSAKNKSVKYFSYLNMNNTQSQKAKFRTKSPGSGDDEFDSALKAARNNNLVVHITDPFENVRHERRNSSPHLGSMGTPKSAPFGSSSDDFRTQSQDSMGVLTSPAVTPKLSDVIIARKMSNPSNDGPVWGQIPNYSSKPSRENVLQQSFTSKQGSTRARTAEPSTGSSRGPVIIGHIKKFQFQGESTKSPFLHHMTKDKHLKKYGDDQRAERERAAARLAANQSQKEPQTEGIKADTVGSLKVTKAKKTRADRSVLSMSMSALPTLCEVAKFEPANFDTSVEKPKNPFLRQNSWERDTSQPSLTNDVPFSRKPFFGAQSSSDRSTTSFYEDNPGLGGKHSPILFSSEDAVEGTFDSASWGDSFDRESFSEKLGFSSSPTTKSGKGGLSRQPSLTREAGRELSRPGMLSRQPSSIGEAGRPPPLSRQNSLSTSALPPIGANGNGIVVNEMQALINSINSVLVAPVPLKHNRPVDVFGRGVRGSASDVSMGEGSYHSSTNNSHNDSLSGSPVRGMLSRGNSFANTNTNSSAFSLSRGNSLRALHSPGTSPPTWNSLRVAIGEDDESLGDTQPNPLSKTYTSTVAFADSVGNPGQSTGLSDTVLKYVPSERRGSFLGDTGEGLNAKDVLQRRKSNASLLNGPVAADIDKLVSARRDSFLVRPEQSAPLMKVTNTSTRSIGNSMESNFQNPLMEEYYDYEQGLQDTGIIIANLHADPLYRILREEIERQQNEETASVRSRPPAVPRARSAHPGHQSTAAIHSAPIPRPLSSRPPKQSAAVVAPTARPTRSANGLSNYKSRVLSSTINPADLKVLSSFHSLPSAGWITCRVVYFLILSFYECVTRMGKHYEYRSILKAEGLWKALEQHITERNMCMEEVDYQYSWPVLQDLLAKFPVVITRVLSAIELGVIEDDAKSIPEFPASIFFDSFPPTKLVYLRDLIKQGMGLFQASELIHMIPVAAQLCDWSKRVIAHIYASCISRLRATQSHTAKVSSVLHSTVPVYNPAEDGTFDPNAEEEETEQRPATLPPNFKFVLAVEDALEEGALFALQSQDSFSNMDGSQLPALALSHTLEKGLNLVKPSDRLDLLLVPPPLREIHSQLSMYGTGVSLNDPFYDGFGSQVTLEGDPLVRLQNDWLLMKHLHERHLQQYAASPLHQVILLPPRHSLYTTLDSYSGTSQVEFDLQTRLDEFIQSQVSPSHLQASQNVPRSVLYNLRAKGVHPILEHSVTAAAAIGGITQSAQPYARAEQTSTQADVVITRLRDGKLPAFVQRNVLTAAGSLRIAEHER